ncbi:hypothetical protein NL676_038526 [Syzygium grande]|nr:hypothetical protein NL676_038526 [Syzygium grande]
MQAKIRSAAARSFSLASVVLIVPFHLPSTPVSLQGLVVGFDGGSWERCCLGGGGGADRSVEARRLEAVPALPGQGFYIVSYGLGIYILNLMIGFLSPLVDPELEASDGPMLPTKGSDEFKPFIRRLPEFKFWHSITSAFFIAFLMTFFSMFDVPVFWPILLFYWLVLFIMTMRRQIAHMIKYKYIPFSIGKQKYGGKKSFASTSGSRGD